MKHLSLPEISENESAIHFCKEFEQSKLPKYILGCNEFGESIAQNIEIDGFIDDFTHNKSFSGNPIFKTNQIPENALVVVAVVGRPFTAQNSLVKNGIRSLDYFSFHKYSKAPTLPVWFFDSFKSDFEQNYEKFNWIYNKLSDDLSRNIFQRIINFRLSDDLTYMKGFQDRQKEQYFENFVGLEEKGEIFVDVGAFDGFTSQIFIGHCPGYREIHLFEPEPNNMILAKENLKNFSNIIYNPVGLSNSEKKLKIHSNAQASKVAEDGDTEIRLVALDEHLDTPYTFLKMDIEGGELDAINGSLKGIEKYRPKLALSVYHRSNDFWQIPETVLSACSDYKIYLRHYLEGISETVMYFVPEKR